MHVNGDKLQDTGVPGSDIDQVGIGAGLGGVRRVPLPDPLDHVRGQRPAGRIAPRQLRPERREPDGRLPRPGWPRRPPRTAAARSAATARATTPRATDDRRWAPMPSRYRPVYTLPSATPGPPGSISTRNVPPDGWFANSLKSTIGPSNTTSRRAECRQARRTRWTAPSQPGHPAASLASGPWSSPCSP